MLLALDVGNTTVLVGILEKSDGEWHLKAGGRIDTDVNLTASAFIRKLTELPGFEDVASCEGAVLSSVVPMVAEVLKVAVRRLLKTSAVRISLKSDLGLTFADGVDARSIGHDRLVDAAWAAASMPLPAVTVDMGTATTFNVIGEGGVFKGGVICAGVHTSLRALHEFTAQLPDLQSGPIDHIIGTNTYECMQSGAVAGAAAMIDGLVMGIERELGQTVSLILTGGTAEYVHPMCLHEHTYDPDLMIKGLGYLYERQKAADERKQAEKAAKKAATITCG